MPSQAAVAVAQRKGVRGPAVCVSRPAVLAVMHPKGGVGRSTTIWQLGAKLALRGKRVLIEDLDQGAHLSRTFGQYPLSLPGLQLASSATHGDVVDLVLVDTAPEAQRERAIEVLRRADWAIVPVKGPEASSVQALPMLMQWVAEAGSARVLGFLPTMYKPRRAETRYWMAELETFAERHGARVLRPIGDIASVAAWRLDGHPYAGLAEEVLRAINDQT
jgi:cellulose biosynthesis protein BcsQ